MTTRALQFRLRTLFVAVTDVAVLAAAAALYQRGNDIYIFLATIGVPLVTGLLLIQGPIGRRLRLSVAAALIAHGLTWCLLSPDAKFWRTPYGADDIIGVSLSLGLIAGGIIILALRRQSVVFTCLAITLFFSLLLNVNLLFLCNQLGQALRTELARQTTQYAATGAQSRRPADRMAVAQRAQIVNGDFKQWTGDAPIGWTIGIGATTGSADPKSIVCKMDGPGMMLQGNASTQAWQSVSQSLPVDPQTCYRVTYEARATGLKREAQQFDNCYVGVFVRNLAGNIVSRQISTVAEPEWSRHVIVFRTSTDAEHAEATIFSSKTGSLCVKQARLEQLTPQDSFQVLVEDMDRNYPFFSLKQTDWRGLTERYRPRAEGAKDGQEFSQVIAEMLSKLSDMHVWIESPAGRLTTYRSSYDANFDHNELRRKLRGVREFGRLGFVGRTEEGYGAVVVTSVTADEPTIRQFLSAIEELFEAPGIVIDLRANSGGSEPLASHIAAMFADKRRTYAGALVRSGWNHADFERTGERYLDPKKGTIYLRPVVCLIGPGCVSSGEGFALMMKCLPHVTLVGKATRGASGNPAPVALPNGVDVWYSRWISLLPDGTPLEEKGVPPDISVDHRGSGDPTFDAALKILAGEIAAATDGH